MKLTKKDIKKIEDLGWNVTKHEDGMYTLETWSPANGDMIIEEYSKEDIILACERFDADEEFSLWYGANRGEPSSPGDLWKDCEAQAEMYEKLAEVLKNAK